MTKRTSSRTNARTICADCGHSRRVGQRCYSPVCVAMRQVPPHRAHAWRVRAFTAFICGKLASALLERDADKRVHPVCERILRWQTEAFADMGQRYIIPEAFAVSHQRELLRIMHDVFGDESAEVTVWSTAKACLLLVQDILETDMPTDEQRIYNWLECAVLSLVRMSEKTSNTDLSDPAIRREAYTYYNAMRAAFWQDKEEQLPHNRVYVAAGRLMVVATSRKQARQHLLQSYGLVFNSRAFRGLEPGTRLIIGNQPTTAAQLAATTKAPDLVSRVA